VKQPEKLEDVINQFCAGWSRTNRRPDMGDKTIRSMFSVELARQIRKYAKVTLRTTDEAEPAFCTHGRDGMAARDGGIVRWHTERNGS